MRMQMILAAVALALTLVHGSRVDVPAQVVEAREGQSNPAAVLFRATLYGAGTGLALGGAYALIADDDDPGTGEILKWGISGGAAAGFLIGLIHVATRSDPEGSVGEQGMIQIENGNLHLSPIGILATGPRGVPRTSPRTLGFNLVSVRF